MNPSESRSPLVTPTDLSSTATKDIAAAMNGLLADVFALYVKTKNFHWHLSGPHFRDYHLLFDEQADQIFAMTDPIAERVRKVGGSTLRSIGHIARMQRVMDNDAEYVEPSDMLAELREDNKALAGRLREAHNVCEEHRDIATASLTTLRVSRLRRPRIAAAGSEGMPCTSSPTSSMICVVVRVITVLGGVPGRCSRCAAFWVAMAATSVMPVTMAGS